MRQTAGHARKLAFSFVALSFVTTSCDEERHHPNSRQSLPVDDAARAEELASIANLGGEGRVGARRAARDFVLSALPSAQIAGLSAMEVDGTNYVIAVDVGGQSHRVDLLAVREFFAEGGLSYWRAVPLDQATAALYGTVVDRRRGAFDAYDELVPRDNTHDR